jgi:isocitrate lyase
MTVQAGRKGRIVAASNSEIYKAIGEFGSAIKSIERGIDEIKRDIAASELASSSSRAGIHRRLDDIVQRTANLEGEMAATKHEATAIKDKVAEMETVTVEVKTLRNRAQGAGTLGRVLIRIGIGIVTVAGWATAAYTNLTGRPPP